MPKTASKGNRYGRDVPIVDFLLPVLQPLDLRTTLASGQTFRWEEADGWHWGVLGMHGYALRQEEDGLRVRTTAPERTEAEEAVSGFLRLDDDFALLCRELAQGDLILGEAITRYPGLRLLRQEPWECLASFICSQVSNIPRISGNLRAIAEAQGEPVTLDGRKMWQFPSAERVAEAGEAGLLRLGLGFRAKYLAAAAQAVAEGRLDLMALRAAPYAEAKAALLGLKGVGDKVADCALVFSLDKLEGFPLDRWVRRALEEWYGVSSKISYRDALAWAQERWGQRCGYVQQYLFHYRRLLGREVGVGVGVGAAKV